jgi:hypothetical protein
MKRTPLKRGTSLLKRRGFKRPSFDEINQKQGKGAVRGIRGSKRKIKGNKRKKKSPLSKLKKELWQLCREIQIKRYGSDCYTCTAKDLKGSNRHLGHFISSSICSTELRYSLDNLRIQCYSCNIHKSGNWLAYEQRLRKEQGISFVEELKERNEKTKGGMFREDWYEQRIREYRELL